MARNIAKRFATMTLLYWEPDFGGSGVTYKAPVKFKGFYMTNAETHGGGVSDVVSAADRDNLVLFYMLEPREEGYVSWKHSLDELEEEGKSHIHPGELDGTKKIKKVVEYTMLRTRKRELKTLAFIASVD